MRSSVSRWIRGAVVRFSTRSLNILPGADAFRIPTGSRGMLPIRRTVPSLLSRPYQAPVRSVADRTVTPHRVPVTERVWSHRGRRGAERYVLFNWCALARARVRSAFLIAEHLCSCGVMYGTMGAILVPIVPGSSVSTY